MLIYIEANQVVELLVIHIESGRSNTVVVAGALLRLDRNVLRILEWTFVSTS